ncbi:ABC-F family ATP-binding cassette domain-containing protein [Novosphingobium resinovorum]|uniref:ABC transporter n=1 Tax=Novosphingobium resinovorum TaxID=158500 RepID=A0A031JN79_9SPHN|nr:MULTISPECIES: ABC-F family ATP-binding cassette domain-containing protein [Novosphingobium]AOR79649.1 ABC transporter [Novosphingobium resinovorum]EZP79251.1 ABC transporter ATP-binding protein [Novosphingobium resinovorum]MBF7013401.1 ABC-F family ATP-binding cassette domain-containing protein [Novosphingobium sp. HR1a]WJM25552.1 ABC-F family ATP-binding cassette domain-containing protein [Novosphingobium resinovorum]
MPASISVSHLAWSAPDGRRVLDDLTLDFSSERAGLIGRNGIGKSTLLGIIAGGVSPSRGGVRIHGTVGLLRQTVQTAPGETVADVLGAAAALAVLRRAEAGIATMDELSDADWTLEARAADALAGLGLHLPLDTPLASLSGGQRTRAALAGLVFAEPDFLLLDEPTNNLDAGGRAAVVDMLANWRAGAIVVSHDRELLDTMDAIVELTSLGATRYGGNWSDYSARKAVELATAEHDLAAAQRHRTSVARKAQVTAERQQRRDAAGNRQAERGGMPRILLGARRERAENSGAENRRLAERQRGEADLSVERAKARIEVLQPLSVQVAPTGLNPSREVLTLDHVSAGYGDGAPVLRDVSLRITGPERVAVTGANGSGKSTLLRVILGELAVSSGRVERHVPGRLLDQQVSVLQRESTIAENFMRLNPGLDDNACRAALARFGFRAASADQAVHALSGGQMLRAGLACVLGNPVPPPLLILDEPTNHLDIDAIAAIEAGLLAYDGALIVVSHDRHFLDRIRITRTVELTRDSPIHSAG